MTVHWSARFVGLPYADLGRGRGGCDCWGLACLIYAERLGITLPDYLDYSSGDNHIELAAVIAGASASPLWVPATDGGAEYDIAIFRRGHLETHVGIVVGDRHGLMIHVAYDDCAKIESYRRGPWSTRLAGFYRHADLVSRAVR